MPCCRAIAVLFVLIAALLLGQAADAADLISREVSVFIGAEPDPPFKQVVSREVSLVVTTPTAPSRITQLTVNAVPTGESATLSWNAYNQWAEQDVARYDIYLSSYGFTNVSSMIPYASVPGETFSITLTNMSSWQDHCFAVVPVDAAGHFDPTVQYSANYVIARETVSREVAVFVGAEPDPPYRQVFSREVSILQPYGASYIVLGGEHLTLPMLSTYEAPQEEDRTSVLRASGVGSVLSFPNLTTVQGNAKRGGFLRIEALDGGRVELASVLTLRQSYDGVSPKVLRGIQVLADGTNSVVDLSGLELFEDLAATPGSRLEARNGGTILLGAGRKLALRQISLSATGDGTLLDLSALRTFDVVASPSASCQVQALSGATVALSMLAELGSGSASFLSDGTGSVIDLSALVRLFGSALEAKNAGVIRTPKLIVADRTTLTVRDSAQIAIAQIQKLTNSRVTADATTLVFTDMFHWAGTTFSYLNGGKVTLQQIDLLLTDLNASTNQFWCGDRVEVAWRGSNRTGAAVAGSWTDAIYLSTDDRWDISDILLGTSDQTNGLGSNQVYSASLSVFVPGVMPGDYHILVRSLAFNRAGTNGVENTVSMLAPILIPELVVGVSTNQVFLQSGHARYYRIEVDDGKDLKVSLGLLATNGATELYIRQDAIPTRSQFDVKYSLPFQRDQFVRIPGTQAGTNYLLAYADSLARVPTAFIMKADYLPLELTAITPDHGGNAGYVTIQLIGSKISTNCAAKLVYLSTNNQTQEILPIQTKRSDMGIIVATFDLRGIPPCTADVSLVAEGGETRRLEQGFRIESGEPENLQVNVVGPSAVRKGSSGLYEVTLANKANQDAQFVRMSLVYPEDSNVFWEVDPGLGGGVLTSNDGVLSCLVPSLAPGQQATFTYRLHVGSHYAPANLPRTWVAKIMDPSVILTNLDKIIESMRLQFVARTNLQTAAPSVYAVLENPAAWQTYARSLLVEEGFPLGLGADTVGNQGYIALTKVGCSDTRSDIRSMDCVDECLTRCQFRYGFVWLWICLPPSVLSVGWGVPLCASAAVLEIDSFCTDYCRVTCTPGSADPNDMQGPAGWGPRGFLSGQTPLGYTVNFENRPTAAAAALQVAITNRLDPSLDWRTVELKEIAFGGIRLSLAAGPSYYEGQVPFDGWTWNSNRGWYRGSTPLMVNVKAGIDVQTGLLSVSLTSSDTNTGALPMDAYAGFLPPNRPETFYYQTNESACCGGQIDTNAQIQPGQGYITYTVRSRTNLVSGTVITNAARIYFDWNDPIDTPTVLNTIDAGTPISSVLPLAQTSDQASFNVTWTGQDEDNGSGISAYDIYVSEDNGAFTLWLANTNSTSALFTGQEGHSYGFYSVASDNVGNRESPHATADSVTSVPPGAIPRLSISRRGQNVVISWPEAVTGLVLESVDGLGGATVWRSVGTVPTVEGGQNTISIQPVAASRYYRLRRL